MATIQIAARKQLQIEMWLQSRFKLSINNSIDVTQIYRTENWSIASGWRETQNRFVFGSRIFHFTWKIEAFKTHIDPNKSHVMSSHAWIEIYFFPEDLINASIHNRYRKNRKMMGTSHFFHPLTCLYNLMCSAKNKTVRLFHAEKIVFFSSYAYRWYVPFLTKKQSFASHINEANIFCVDLQ